MPPNGEILFEFKRVGGTVKVTAFHTATLVEAVVVGPANAGEAQLKMLALRKLDYVLAKRQPPG
jgi:hypothetical protein